MNYVSCEYPKVVRNIYTGQDVACRCGKCDACRNIKASEWVTRLDIEAQYHKYVLFCTLTYDDLHVPQIVRLRKDNYPNASYIDSVTGEIIDCRDIKANFDSKDWKFIADSKVVNVLSKRDFQLFIKLLRYNFTTIDKNAKLRYYIAGEYGPTTYRPHGHLLLFFDSPQCASQIEVLLRESWPHGAVYDPHFVEGSASDYCASYINSFSNLPSLYRHKSLRPFSLFSKSPCIGSQPLHGEKVREIFFGGDYKISYFNPKTRQFDDVPLWRSLKSRLYPRLSRFEFLTHHERVLCYRAISELKEKGYNVADCCAYIRDKYVYGNIPCFLSHYFRCISSKLSEKSHFISECYIPWKYQGLPFLPADVVIPKKFKVVPVSFYEFNYDSLYNFLQRAYRALRDCETFNLNLNEYVSIIEDFYSKVSYTNLVKFYDFQNEYLCKNPKWHLIYFDYVFYKKVISTDYDALSSESKVILNDLFDFNVPLKQGRLDIPYLRDLREYKDMIHSYKVMSFNKTKQKSNNDYLWNKSYLYNNIISYKKF